jgi:hypothetical protein
VIERSVSSSEYIGYEQNGQCSSSIDVLVQVRAEEKRQQPVDQDHPAAGHDTRTGAI